MTTRNCIVSLAFPLMFSLASASANAGCPSIYKGQVNVMQADMIPVTWNCPAGFNRRSFWFELFFELKNPIDKRTAAVKMQANLIDGFGEIVRTWPFTESANLGKGDLDTEIYAERQSSTLQATDHIELYVLALKYQDGTVWTNPMTPRVGPLPTPEDKFSRSQ